jgi:hypothetical protein
MNAKFEFKVKIKSRMVASKRRRQLADLLKKIGDTGVQNIKSEIKKRKLIDTGKMYRSVKYKRIPKGVEFIVKSPAPYLEKGIRKHQMKYLMDSSKPIPVDIANSVFRWATPKSMSERKWIHPGFTRGKGFIKRGMERTTEKMKKEIVRVAGGI